MSRETISQRLAAQNWGHSRCSQIARKREYVDRIYLTTDILLKEHNTSQGILNFVTDKKVAFIVE